MPSWVLPFLFLLVLPVTSQDLDRDTLPDSFEQEILDQFAPRFLIASDDCDVEPSSFQADQRDPKPGPRNGTLYGQVFPNGRHIEVHYYHLWSKDCGRNSHALDVEHVSALVDPQTVRALYWYAGAHAGTLCDAGHGAKAGLIEAEQGGPLIWVSRDKHASFLEKARCPRGCGGDDCSLTKRWLVRGIVNIGEPNFPLHGALWIGSAQWNFASKMNSHFAPAAQAALASSESVTDVQAMPPSVRSVIGVGNTTMNALGTADQHTRSAIGTANRKTRSWLGRAKLLLIP